MRVAVIVENDDGQMIADDVIADLVVVDGGEFGHTSWSGTLSSDTARWCLGKVAIRSAAGDVAQAHIINFQSAQCVTIEGTGPPLPS